VEEPIVEYRGMFSFMLRRCVAGILDDVLDPAIPFVWIRRHMPRRQIVWWPAHVPLSTSGALHDVEVRSMEFDLQLGTSRFLELLPEFADHGLVLFHMTRRVADTLTLDRVDDDSINRVLIQNGLHLKFYLPHAGESAQVASPHREVLSALLQKPRIRDAA
jgi:hypothetical protein